MRDLNTVNVVVKEAEAATPHHGYAVLGPCAVEVRAGEAWVLRWLADGLGPHVRLLPDLPPGVRQVSRLVVHADPAALDALAALDDWADAHPAPIYGKLTGRRVLDTDHGLLSAAGATTIWMRENATLYLVHGVVPLPRHHLEHHAKLALKQSLRLAGFASLHCAAAVIDGAAVLLSGSSGAGKSTMLAALLQSGAGYLASDVAFIDTTQDPPGIIGWPQPIRFGGGTVAAWPWLNELRESDDPVQQVLRLGCGMGVDNKLELHPLHVNAILGAGTVHTGAPLGAVILPKLDLSGAAARATWLSDHGRDVIHRQLTDERPGYDWFPVVDPQMLAEADARNAQRALEVLTRVAEVAFGGPESEPYAAVTRLLNGDLEPAHGDA